MGRMEYSIYIIQNMLDPIFKICLTPFFEPHFHFQLFLVNILSSSLTFLSIQMLLLFRQADSR